VIAGGILAAVLTSAAGTAIVGGIAGALIGLGIPEAEAAYYEGEFKSGRTIITVRADARLNEAETILRRHGGYNHDNKSSAGSTTKAATPAQSIPRMTGAGATTTGQTVRLHEEQLHAHKEAVPVGEVRAHAEVKTQRQSFEVPVQREELVIERRPVGERGGKPSDIRAGEEIRIPLKEEKVRLDKEVVATEEVTLGKRKVQDTERVSGTIRKEELKVDNPRADDKGRTPDQRVKSK